jgi:aspartate aminotransferase-like enzyme
MYGWHIVAKQYTIERIKAMGLSLWAVWYWRLMRFVVLPLTFFFLSYKVFDDISSPTVTAVTVPDGWTWKQLDSALRASGVCFGGSYGKLEGKVRQLFLDCPSISTGLSKRGILLST